MQWFHTALTTLTTLRLVPPGRYTVPNPLYSSKAAKAAREGRGSAPGTPVAGVQLLGCFCSALVGRAWLP